MPAEAETRRIDPFDLEIIRNGIKSITDEMELNLTRTAFSPLIYEYKDYAVGILDVEGRVITQGVGGLPIFLSDLGYALKDSLEVLGGTDSIRQGDAIIHNYAPVCGQHLNNVNMYTPVFSRERLVAFVGVRIHFADIGGKDMGSSGNDTVDIFQEGIQYRALKICKNGVIDQEILRVIECNSRLPDIVRGDLMAQLAACRVGEARFSALASRFGWELVRDAVDHIWRESELLARRAVANMPDGTYSAETFLDNDGIDLDTPLRVKATVTVARDRLCIDLSEMNRQVKGPFNSGRNGGGYAVAKVAFKLLTTGTRPADDGCFRNLDIVLPEGTFVSASPNAPLGRYSTPLATVCDVILKACGDAVPEQAIAGHHAQVSMYNFFGVHPETGKLFKHTETIHGGWGATAEADGFGPSKTILHGDNRDIPVEIQEALFPLRVERYELRPDSAGAGARRGGLGVRRTYRILHDMRMTTMMERTRHSPWGIFGGADGTTGYTIVRRPGEAEFSANKTTDCILPAGTIVEFRSSGGGGYGDPKLRPPESVRQDVRQGYISAETADRDYDVRISET